MTTKPPRTTAANQARQARTQAKLERVEEALRVMRRERARITYPAVVRRADVSRTFLYQHPDASALMANALAGAGDQRRKDQTDLDAHLEATWRERALNAEDALGAANREIDTQRNRIGQLLGQIRDLEVGYPQEAAQRLATQNTNLKAQIRQLTQDNRTLEDKLQASRTNNRFLDKRIADLEAQILESRVT
jgi:hypothetical protein